MAREQSSPWADWRFINWGEALWFSGALTPLSSPAVPLGQTDTDIDRLNLLADASVQGGATSKPSFGAQSIGSGGENYNGYQYIIALPDFLANKQQANLVEWSGASGDEMGEGSLRVALLLENVLFSAIVPGGNGTLAEFHVSGKFRGYGQASNGTQTQDAPVAGTFFDAASAFPDMSLPGVDNGPASFVDGGGRLVRIQTLIEVPNTVAVGDVLELNVLFRAGANFGNQQPGTTIMQWLVAKYQWVTPPYLFAPNTSFQLTETSSDLTDESQPRLDEGPYEP